MKVLFTGASGFFGSFGRAFKRLKNHSVLWATTKTPPERNLGKFQPEYIDLKTSNLQVDAIVHAAAAIPQSFSNTTYGEHFLHNVNMTNNLVEFAQRVECSRFIFLSSFGTTHGLFYEMVDDFYTAAKVSSELLCSTLNQSGCRAISLRIPSPYGEFMPKDRVVSRFLLKALSNEDIEVYGEGTRRQNFVYIGDVFDVIESSLETDSIGTYSLLSKTSPSLLELALLTIDATESKSRVVKLPTSKDISETKTPAWLTAGIDPNRRIDCCTDLKRGLAKTAKWIANG